MEPTDTASKSTSHGRKKVFTSLVWQGKIRLKCRLMIGGLVTVKEQDSEVAVVHGCFTEVGDSILCDFFYEPLRTKLQDVQRV